MEGTRDERLPAQRCIRLGQAQGGGEGTAATHAWEGARPGPVLARGELEREGFRCDGGGRGGISVRPGAAAGAARAEEAAAVPV